MRRVIPAALLLCILGLRPATLAQTPQGPLANQAASSNATAVATTGTVRFLAIDKEGSPITDLKAEVLRVRVNKEERKILSLSPTVDDPKTIGFFFDVSGSRHEDKHVREEIQLASEFLHSIWHQGDTAFVAAFDGQFYPVVQPSHQVQEVDEGLAKILQISNAGPTAIYDALCLVLRPEKLAGINGWKGYIVFSDFEDNASKNRADNVVEIAHEGGVSIFPFILGEGFGGNLGLKRLKKEARERALDIADQTGGEAEIPESHKQLAATLQRVGNEMRATYLLTYAPSAASLKNKKQEIRLETTRPQVKLIYPKTQS